MSDLRVRYKGTETSLAVRLIQTWHRGDIPALAMSNSSGAKDTMKNTIYKIFDRDDAIDAISMVRGGGPPILLIRIGAAYFDVESGRPGDPPHAGKEVEVMQKKSAAPAGNIRPAESEAV